MGQYYTDFSEVINSVNLSWSLDHLEIGEDPDLKLFNALFGGDFTVQDFGGDKVIRHQQGFQSRSSLVWSEAGYYADVEALVKVYVDTTGPKSSGLFLRANGRSSNESGYRFIAWAKENDISIGKYRNGTYSLIGSSAYSYTTGWYWIRGRVEGTALKLRVWAEGDPEPTAWDLELTDSVNTLEHGWCGIFDFEGGSDPSYFSDFEVTGAPLHQEDWRMGWGGSLLSKPRVEDDASAEGGKVLFFEQETYDRRRLFIWDGVPPASQIKVTAKWKLATVATGYQLLRVRAQGFGGREVGYFLTRPFSGSIALQKYRYGTVSSTIASASFSPVAGTWYQMRFEADGASFKARFWADGDPEPGTWDIDTIDTTTAWNMTVLGQKGWFGVGSFNKNTSITWDWISVGTDGDEPL